MRTNIGYAKALKSFSAFLLLSLSHMYSVPYSYICAIVIVPCKEIFEN